MKLKHKAYVGDLDQIFNEGQCNKCGELAGPWDTNRDGDFEYYSAYCCNRIYDLVPKYPKFQVLIQKEDTELD